jgi:hypothetical protein
VKISHNELWDIKKEIRDIVELLKDISRKLVNNDGLVGKMANPKAYRPDFMRLHYQYGYRIVLADMWYVVLINDAGDLVKFTHKEVTLK